MSSKKSLLTESEVRRFMALANIPSIGKAAIKENAEVFEMDKGAHQAQAEAYPQEAAEPAGEEEMDMGELEGGEGEEAAGGDKEAKFQELVSMLADLVGVDVEMDAGGEEAGEEEMEMSAEEEGEEEGEEEEAAEEEADEEDEGMMKEAAKEEEEETDESKKLDESKLVEAVLARVTARLVAEAKKKKEAKGGKKMSAAEKMKAMKAAKDKKKKLEEANAPAPKATNSNGPKKGAGSATKGTFGVTSKVHDQEWGKTGKGDHEMEAVSASAEHTTSHGKKNLATQGGNKKK